MRPKRFKWYTKLIIALSILFVAVSIIPYLIPVTKASSVTDTEIDTPYNDSAFETINGTSIHYRKLIPPDCEIKGKILLVHGLGSSVFCWRNNAEALLQEGYMVIEADLPGFGYSDRSREMDHSQNNRAVILWELLERTDLTLEPQCASMKWDLAGHSMGGGTVTAMVIAEPERSRSLILIDGALFPGGPLLRGMFRYPPAGRWLEVILRHQILREDRIEKILGSAYGSEATVDDIEGYLSPLQRAGTEGALVDMVRTATSIDDMSFSEITVPAFAIWGENDPVVPLTESERLKALLPGLDVKIIAEAGHCPMETDSREFNIFLIEALEQAGSIPTQ